jgi:tyrosyl-DNA phosphodiesterase 2
MDSIEMIGKEAILGVSYYKEKIRKESQMVELPVFPSDHFGLVLTITQQENDSF